MNKEEIIMGSHSWKQDVEKNNDWLVMAIVTFVFGLIVAVSLLVTEEEITAFTARFF